MTIQTRDPDFVIIDRNSIVENRHQVHAAVVDSSGTLLYHLGDPFRFTLVRSATKPAQALAVVETGALERFSFDEADLALMCASHSSEERHVARARSMLAKAQNQEDHLCCGGHVALSPVVNAAWTKNGFVPTAICNNCSGKHAGMLAGAKAIGAPAADYHLPSHPIQACVKKVVQDLSGLDEDGVEWGLDGCNMPAPALPLNCLACIYASFARTADAVEDESAVRPRTQHMGRIFNAMARHPEMVGGEGRFCTTLMKAFEGTVVGKLGADGCYGIGIRKSEWTRSHASLGSIGIAVKIEDGNIDILYAAVTEILKQLKIGTSDMRQPLEAFHHLKFRNTMGVVTGQASFPFKLRPA